MEFTQPHEHAADLAGIHCRMQLDPEAESIQLESFESEIESQIELQGADPQAAILSQSAMQDLQSKVVGPEASPDVHRTFASVVAKHLTRPFDATELIVFTKLLSATARYFTVEQVEQHLRDIPPDSKAWGTGEELLAAVLYRPRDASPTMSGYLEDVIDRGASVGIRGAALKTRVYLAEAREEPLDHWIEVAGGHELGGTWPARQVLNKFGTGAVVKTGEIFDTSELDVVESPHGGQGDLDLQHGEKSSLVVFWATWCGYCKTHMMDFHDAYREDSSDIEFVFLNIDGDAHAVENYRRRWPMPWVHLTPVNISNADLLELYGVKGLPYFFLLDADGVVVAQGSDPSSGRLGTELRDLGLLKSLTNLAE